MSDDRQIIAHIMKENEHPIFEIAFNVFPGFNLNRASEMVSLAMENMGYKPNDYYMTVPVEVE